MRKLITAVLLLFCLACQDEPKGVTYLTIDCLEEKGVKETQFWFGINFRVNEYAGEDGFQFKDVSADYMEVAIKGHLSKLDAQQLCFSEGRLMFAETVAAYESRAVLFELDSILGRDILILSKPTVGIDSINASKALISTSQLLENETQREEDSIIQAWAVYEKPFSSLIHIFNDLAEEGEIPWVGTVAVEDTATVSRLFVAAQERGLLADMRFVLGTELVGESEQISLYSIRYSSQEENYEGLSGDYVKEAQIYDAPDKGFLTQIIFNEEGAPIWEELTRKETGRYIAIVLDDKVWSCPKVNGAIKDGYTHLELGDAPLDQIRQFAIIINIKIPGHKGEMINYRYDSTAVWSP